MRQRVSYRSQGADLVAGGVQYRTWAPGKAAVEAVIFDTEGGGKRTVSLGQEDEDTLAASILRAARAIVTNIASKVTNGPIRLRALIPTGCMAPRR